MISSTRCCPILCASGHNRIGQEAAWLWLARNPTALVGEIRDGVVQLSDTMLWRSRTQPRLVGLRAGLMLGSVLERCRNAAMRMASPARRRLYANVRNKTRAVQRAGVADRTAGIGGMENERDIFDRSSGPDHRGLVAGQDAGGGSSRSADGHP